MKKIISLGMSILICLLLCIVLCSCEKNESSSVELKDGKAKSSPIEDFTYEFKDGEAIITGYIGTDMEIVVPDTIKERPVTCIGYNEEDRKGAFEGYDMTSIVIPKGVERINDCAFEDCKMLERISLPESLQGFYIENESKSAAVALADTAWYKNQADGILYLDNILIGVKGKNLDTDIVEIRNGTKIILANAFVQEDNILSVNIPNSVKYIGDKAFYGCDKLEKINIPEDAILGVKVLDGLGNMPGYIVSTTVSDLKSEEFAFSLINDNELMITEYLGNKKDVVIPETFNSYKVTVISHSVFQGENITSVKMPDTIKEIRDYAFAGNKNLTSVTLSKKLKVIGVNAFWNCKNLTQIDLPESIEKVGVYAFSDSGLTSVSIPESSTFVTLNDYTFFQCLNLEEVTIPATMTKISDNAFSECPDSITINAPSGSYAEKYADRHKFDFNAD